MIETVPPATCVRSYSRVHLGLFQLSNSYTPINMGLGFSLERPYWELVVDTGQSSTLKGSALVGDSELSNDCHRLLSTLIHLHPGTSGITVECTEGYASHIGLGAKTSLLLGLIAGYSHINSLTPWPKLMRLAGRGGTSGSGVNLALHGGLILDSGHRETGPRLWGPSSLRSGAELPSVVTRWDLPAWPLLMCTPTKEKGVFGDHERKVFSDRVPLAKAEVDSVAGLCLYEVLPALTAQDKLWFATALDKLQRVGFKQHEWTFQSQTVHAIRQVASANGARCVALSSMGPTVMIISDDLPAVREVIEKHFGSSVSCWITQPRNVGLEIEPQ